MQKCLAVRFVPVWIATLLSDTMDDVDKLDSIISPADVQLYKLANGMLKKYLGKEDVVDGFIWPDATDDVLGASKEDMVFAVSGKDEPINPYDFFPTTYEFRPSHTEGEVFLVASYNPTKGVKTKVEFFKELLCQLALNCGTDVALSSSLYRRYLAIASTKPVM